MNSLADNPEQRTWRARPEIAWLDAEPDAIALINTCRPDAVSMLIPEPFAGLWRLVARPGGATLSELLAAVHDPERILAKEVVSRFLRELADAGLVDPETTPRNSSRAPSSRPTTTNDRYEPDSPSSLT